MSKHIVLYNSAQSGSEKRFDIYLGLLSIAAIPYQEGYEIRYINHSDDNSFEKLIDNSKEALCVCLGVMTGNQIIDALKVCKAIKEKYPKIPIIWGGWHISILPEQTMECPYIDIGVLGQGQRTFVELVHALEKKMPLKKIKGIIFKKNGKLVKTLPRKIENINEFPPIPYEILSENQLIRPVDEISSRVIDYFTSQGCPHRCTFCADPLVYQHMSSMLTPERVVTDIEKFVKKYNVNGVVITDTNFFVNPKRVKAIGELLLKNNIKISWGSVNGRTEHLLRLPDKTWNLLKKINFSSFLIGAESGLDTTLNFIQKDATVKQTLQLTKKCKEYGFKIYYSFMFGLPPNPESKDSYKKQMKNEWNGLLDITDKILSISKNHMFYFLIYTPYPGTALYALCKKNGFKEPKNLKGWGEFAHHTTNTPWVTKKYEILIDQLNVLFIPFLTENFYGKLNKYGTIGKLAKLAFAPIHGLVLLRWKIKFFSFPIEYYMLKYSKKWGRKLILKI